MKRKILYIINPISGNRDKDSVRTLIEQKTGEAGIAFQVYPSLASGDYSYLLPITREEKFTDIVIAGGDGTINAVVNSLRKAGLPFGIVPCGSGNGLAFSAGIPGNPQKALEIIFRGENRETDAFMINDRFACMLCGLGLDAQVAHDFANDPKRGLTTYLKKTIANFFTASSFPFTIEVGGRSFKTDAYFISMANSNQFGNHFTIAPQASLNDGLLDIVIMTKQNKLSALLSTIMQVGGYNRLQETDVLDEKASVIYFQTAAIRITNKKAAPMHIDGDPVETETVLNVKLLPACFRLIQ